MATTFKAEIQNKRADGTYNVRIRVTHNRDVRRISTKLYVTDEDISRKTLKIKNVRIIEQCNDLIKKCRDICAALGFSIDMLAVDELVSTLKLKLEGGERFTLDFIQYMRDKAASMKKSTGDTYSNAASALRRYLAGVDLDISDINTAFLRSFEKFLQEEPSQRGNNRKNNKKETVHKGGRAISKYLACVRAIHNMAKEEFNDEDRGVIRIPYSPFKTFTVKPQPKTRKRALTVPQVQAIIDIPYTDSTRFNLAKDCFILSFALIGINSVDMYHAKHPKKKILTYNRQKTESRRDDGAEMRVKLEGCIAALLEKYQDRTHLFGFHKMYATPDTFNRAINIGLKLIGKEVGIDDLEFYAARHSWATIARSAEVGIDKATVHEALNHVDDAMKVTDIYIDRDWSVIWNANAKVLSLFDWSAVGYDLL